MEELLKSLYEKFLLRDVLGKVTPGALATTASAWALGYATPPLLTTLKDWNWYALALIPVFYLVGVALQIIGEFLGLHSAAPYPKAILLVPTRKTWRQAYDDFSSRLSLIRRATSAQWPPAAQEQRERFVYLKEGCGNMALALLLLALARPAWMAPHAFGQQSFLLALGALFMWLSHVIHARRQATFEIKTLSEASPALAQPNEWEAMRLRLDIGTCCRWRYGVLWWLLIIGLVVGVAMIRFP